MTDEKPKKYTLRRARGRGNSSATREPELTEVELVAEDGDTVVARLPRDGTAVHTHVQRLIRAERMDFDKCPICLADNPQDKEHVPPESVGGGRMTKTCATCNGRYGSKFESELQRQWDYEFGRFTLRHPLLPGDRHLKKVKLRLTDAGQPLIFLDLPAGQGYKEAFASGAPFDVNHEAPDPVLWTWAVLKSAYLGACLILRKIVPTPEATAVREALLAARDADRADLAPPPFQFSIARIDGEAQPGCIELIHITDSHRATDGEFGVLLGGVLYVSWVFGGYWAEWNKQTDERRAIPMGGQPPGA